MWFTETPWPPFLICAVAATLLFIRWSSDRRPVYVVGLVGLLLTSGVIFAVESVIVTDAERVESSVIDIVDSFRLKDRDKTLGYISEQAAAERAMVAGALETVDVENDVRITDMQVELLAEGSRARAHFRVNATASYMGHRDRARTRWMLTWQREGADWKVIGIERLQTLGNEPLEPFARTAN